MQKELAVLVAASASSEVPSWAAEYRNTLKEFYNIYITTTEDDQLDLFLTNENAKNLLITHTEDPHVKAMLEQAYAYMAGGDSDVKAELANLEKHIDSAHEFFAMVSHLK